MSSFLVEGDRVVKLWVAEPMNLFEIPGFIAGFLLIVLAIVPRIPLPGGGYWTGGGSETRVVLFVLGLAFLIWSFLSTGAPVGG